MRHLVSLQGRPFARSWKRAQSADEKLDTIIATGKVALAQAVGQLLADPRHGRPFRYTEAASCDSDRQNSLKSGQLPMMFPDRSRGLSTSDSDQDDESTLPHPAC
jgi:hypothetical protein